MKKNHRNKIAKATMAASLVATAGFVVEAQAADAQFTDVKSTSSHAESIKNLADQGIISGFGDNTYRPDLHVTRGQAAKILANTLGLNIDDVEDPQFKDIPATHQYYKYIAALKKEGIISGYEDGTFRPSAKMTRGHMAKILAEGFDLGQDESAAPFTDIAASSYKGYIGALYKYGVTTGRENNTFGPTDKVTRAQMATFAVRASNTSTSEEAFDLSIMHTNDSHARTDKYPVLATAVKEIRADKPEAVLIDAGDVFSGTLFFNTFEGEADLKLMNYIGYDIMTLGNHEFDLGSSPNGHKALADFIKAAQFSLVSSNVDVSADVNLQGLFSDVISSKPEEGRIYNGMIKEVDGEKVGFFGLTTEETKDIASPGSVAFENYIEEAKKAVQAFEGMGVNKIVAVTHIGYDDNPNMDNDLLLAKHVDGIDVIVGGHSHTVLEEPTVITAGADGEEKDPTVIVQTGQYLDNLGTLDVTFDKDGIVQEAAGELIELNADVYAPDEAAAAILKPYAERVKEVQEEEIGLELPVALDNPRNGDDVTAPSVRRDDTLLGNLITDGMLAKAREVVAGIDADKEVIMALQNGGGIRAAIDAGPVTVGEVITVLPFGNTLAVVDLTGAELKAVFEHSVSAYPIESGGFLHIAGGVVEFDSSKPVGERVVSIKYGDGIEVEADKTYTVATNAFTAMQGGDGYTMLKAAYEDGRVTDLGLSDWENFRDYLLSLDEVPNEVEDRVQNVSDGSAPVLETISIAEARQLGSGKTAQVKGIVTAVLSNTIHMEDETGGIALYRLSGDVAVGDEVTVSGGTTEYRGMFQLQNGEVIERTEAAADVTPTTIAGKDVAEANESKFALVEKVKIVAADGSNYDAETADGGKFIVRDERGDLNLEVGKTYDEVAGIIQQFNDDYQIIPRSTDDVVADTSVVRPVAANPGAGLVAAGSTVELSTATEGATIYYTTDGSTPTMASTKYEAPITIAAETTITTIAVKDGLNQAPVQSFTYKTYDPAKGLQIHDIQGEGHTSVMNGQKVDGVQGVVTAVYEQSGGFYFHMQTQDAAIDNNPKTSQGIVVYTGNKNTNVAVGNLVAVTGTVNEYGSGNNLTVTQIAARDDQGGKVNVLNEKVALPAPVKLTTANLNHTVIDNDQFANFDPQEDGIDFWESLEGMRVEAAKVKAVAPQNYGEVFAVLDGAPTTTKNGGLLLTATSANPHMIPFRMYNNDATRDLAESFAVATGDKFDGPIVGVVNYDYSNFKVMVDYEDMKNAFVKGATVQETTAIQQAAGKLTVASYNLENFSANVEETSNEKAANIAKAFVTGLNSPDIIGVTEVQDGNGSLDTGDASAAASYERLIKAIEDAGGPTYKYVNIDPINNKDGGAPGANIRVGFLYNADRVSLTAGITTGDAATAVGYDNGNLTLNPGVIAPADEAFNASRKPLAAQFTFNGEQVIVIANHWNSKSSDMPLWGKTQPPVLATEKQRVDIAKIVGGFVADIKAKNPAANVVAVGDFNDFQWAAPLKELEKAGLYNMINDVPAEGRYTYTFNGNSQVLDHILVSENLKANTIVDILNVNSDFTEMHGRASDHDPVIVQIDFNK